jgi:2-dehydro-3-deoxygluconokinase
MTGNGAGGGVLTFGETMALFRSEDVGALSHERSLRLGIGGTESNVAIGLRRLGVPAQWIGRVGHDPLGALVTRELRAEDVNLTVIADGSAPTGIMVKENRAAGITNVVYYRTGSAGSRLSPADIPAPMVRNAALVHVTGITAALSDSALEAVRHAIAVARDAGVLVSFDLNYRRALWGPERAGEVYRELIARSDIVFAGADEAAIAVGAAPPALLAERLAALGPSQAVVKLGEQGAVALIDGVAYKRDAVRITPVDTVGAGDAFVAGYLCEVIAGRGPDDRLLTAARTGAFACLSRGDWEGLPYADELHKLEASEGVTR